MVYPSPHESHSLNIQHPNNTARAMDDNKFPVTRTRPHRSHPPGFYQEQLMSLLCDSEIYKHFPI